MGVEFMRMCKNAGPDTTLKPEFAFLSSKQVNPTCLTLSLECIGVLPAQ